MNLLRLVVLLGVLPTLVNALGCEGRGTEPTGSSDRINVVATTGMVADLVRSVGGDHVHVHNLISEGIDPHLYKPSRDDIAALMAADIVFYNGLLLEGKMGQALQRTSKNTPVIAVAEEIPEGELLYPDDAGGHPDPHVWLDASLWARCSEPVAQALSTLHPAGRTDFDRNQKAFTNQALELDAYGREMIATIPPDARILVTSHDAFSYFGRAYGLEVLGVQGISTESEAGLADIEALVNLLVERQVPAVFVESSVPARSVKALIEGARARGTQIVIGGELFSDAMGESGTYEGTWTGMVDHDVTTVTNALGGSAPSRGLGGSLAQGDAE